MYDHCNIKIIKLETYDHCIIKIITAQMFDHCTIKIIKFEMLHEIMFKQYSLFYYNKINIRIQIINSFKFNKKKMRICFQIIEFCLLIYI